MKRQLDLVRATTSGKAYEKKTKRKNNDEYDFDVSKLDDLVPGSYTYGDTNSGYVGTRKITTSTSQISNAHLIKAPLADICVEIHGTDERISWSGTMNLDSWVHGYQNKAVQTYFGPKMGQNLTNFLKLGPKSDPSSHKKLQGSNPYLHEF